MLELPFDARAGAGRIAFAPYEGPRLGVRGVIAELVEKRGSRKTRRLARLEEALKRRFPGPQVPFRWVRLDHLPADNSGSALVAAIEAGQHGFGTPRWEAVAGGEIAIVAALFREEVRQGEYEDAWLFVARARTPEGESEPYVIRGERLSREDLEARLPERIRFGRHAVALAGLGALGAEIAVELAKTGLGRLRGLDFDTVESGTVVRWSAGLTTVGRLKTGYLEERITVDYPYTNFEPILMQIGSSARGGLEGRGELEVLEAFLADADLLIDATAEIGVQQALAAIAREHQLPAIFVSATEGALGGLVARIAPAGACWHCLQQALEEGEIPIPAHAEPSTLQPRGCSDLTYRGAGFDLLPISAQALRAAAVVLSGSADPAESVVHVCSLEEDGLGAPEWRTYSLERHQECPICAEAEQ
jgi:molybdopterin/thiamine biosynthesis adenylyltransferase